MELVWKKDKKDNIFFQIKTLDSIVNLCYFYDKNTVFLNNELCQTEIQYTNYFFEIHIDLKKIEIKQKIFVIPGYEYNYEIALLLYCKNIFTTKEYDVISNFLRALRKYKGSKKRFVFDFEYNQNNAFMVTNEIPSNVKELLLKLL